MKQAILGGGLTGLTLNYLLSQKGFDVEVLEKEADFGGLMRTCNEAGFAFDYCGSHIVFSRNKESLSFLLGLLGDNKLEKKRNTKVFFKGLYVKYPFENGLAGLEKQDNFDCLITFIDNLLNKEGGKVSKPTNMKDWFYYTFGKGIAEKYLIPYNQKIWKYPLEDMSLEWVERVPNPPVSDIVKSSLGIETEGYSHQSVFYYPKKGGIQALIRALCKLAGGNRVAGFEVKRLRKEGPCWVVSNGKDERIYDKVISTIPIQDLIKAMEAPKKVRDASSDLKYNSLITVMLGLNTKGNDFSWLYIPDKDCLSHRVSFPSNFSPSVVPKGKSSVLAEITCTKDSVFWKMSDEEIVDRVTEDLHCLKIIDKTAVCFAKCKRTTYAYVITDMNYRQNLKILNDYVSEAGINLLGRFSEYKYLNMDACVENVMNYVKNLP